MCEIDAPKCTLTKNCLKIKVTKSNIITSWRLSNQSWCASEISLSLVQSIASCWRCLAFLESGRRTNAGLLFANRSVLFIWHIVKGISALRFLGIITEWFFWNIVDSQVLLTSFLCLSISLLDRGQQILAGSRVETLDTKVLRSWEDKDDLIWLRWLNDGAHSADAMLAIQCLTIEKIDVVQTSDHQQTLLTFISPCHLVDISLENDGSTVHSLSHSCCNSCVNHCLSFQLFCVFFLCFIYYNSSNDKSRT